MTDHEPDHPKEVAGVGPLPATYPHLLADIKTRIRQTRTRAALSVNAELIRLYWEIGGAIVERQRREGWGTAVIERLSKDLREAFPGLRGFSTPNLWRMRSFYLAYREEDTILSQPVIEFAPADAPPELLRIPWGHNGVLVFKVSSREERLWHARQTFEHRWSRAVLNHRIDSDLC